MQGLGTHRLDPTERNLLLEKEIYYFDADATPAPRRAASAGPSTLSNTDGMLTSSRSHSRGMTARASSLMPRTPTIDRLASPTRRGSTNGDSRVSPSRPSTRGRSPSLIMSRSPSTPRVSEGDAPPYAIEQTAMLRTATLEGSRTPSSHRTHDRASELRAEAYRVNHPQSSADGRAANAQELDGSVIDSERSRTLSPYTLEEAIDNNHHNVPHASTSRHTIPQNPSITAPDSMPSHSLELVDSNISQHSLSSQSDPEERGRSAFPARSDARRTSVSHSPTDFREDLNPFPLSVSDSTQNPAASVNATIRSTIPSVSPSPMGRSSSPGHAGLPTSLSNRRASASSGTEIPKSKSARFSLSSFVRGKSVSNSGPRQASPDLDSGSVASVNGGKAASHNSRRSTGLKAIKQAFASSASVTPLDRSDSDDEGESDDDDARRGRARNAGWQEFKAGTYTYAIYGKLPLLRVPSKAKLMSGTHWQSRFPAHCPRLYITMMARLPIC